MRDALFLAYLNELAETLSDLEKTAAPFSVPAALVTGAIGAGAALRSRAQQHRHEELMAALGKAPKSSSEKNKRAKVIATLAAVGAASLAGGALAPRVRAKISDTLSEFVTTGTKKARDEFDARLRQQVDYARSQASEGLPEMGRQFGQGFSEQVAASIRQQSPDVLQQSADILAARAKQEAPGIGEMAAEGFKASVRKGLPRLFGGG